MAGRNYELADYTKAIAQEAKVALSVLNGLVVLIVVVLTIMVLYWRWSDRKR